MFCKNCGGQLPDGASFCGRCGAPPVPAPKATAPSTSPQGGPPNKNRQALWIGLAVTAVIIIAAAVTMTLLLLRDGDDQSTTNTTRRGQDHHDDRPHGIERNEFVHVHDRA